MDFLNTVVYFRTRMHLFEISGSHDGEYEDESLLAFSAV
jgi:hypothetical protein